MNLLRATVSNYIPCTSRNSFRTKSISKRMSAELVNERIDSSSSNSKRVI